MTPQQLRNSILQMAIEGKLTWQLPEDGNAADLLKKIKAEKAKLIKEKKIKKEKPLPEIGDDEIPFGIPDNWCWVRFGDVVVNRDSERVPLSVAQRNILDSVYDYYGASGVIDKVDDYLFDKTLLLIGEDGANLLSRSTPVAFLASGKYWVNNHAHVLDCTDGMCIKYVMWYINSISLAPYVTGTAQPKMNQANMNRILVPLPPAAEQKRIVARLEEILPLVDAYEKAYNELKELNKKFPVNLKNSLLQMAIEGKLVEQRSEDGNAADLLKKIKAEKAKLIKEKKIKKEKPLPEIRDDEIPFEIPENWCVARFAEFGLYKKGPFGSALTKSIFVPKGENTVKVYEQKNAIQKNVQLGEYYISQEYFDKKMQGFELHPGDVIVSCAGTIGETYVMPENFERGIINQALMRMTLMPSVNLKFFLLYFDVILKENARRSSKGSAIKNIPPFDELKKYIVLLPPLAEQKRIVDRLEQLLSLCDELMKHG